MFTIKIERNTRQWLPKLAIGASVAALAGCPMASRLTGGIAGE